MSVESLFSMNPLPGAVSSGPLRGGRVWLLQVLRNWWVPPQRRRRGRGRVCAQRVGSGKLRGGYFNTSWSCGQTGACGRYQTGANVYR